MKYVFLDTNVFLQFKDFEQIPWGELVRDNDFTIIVSEVVSREIDKHKDSARGKVQKRAKKVSRKLANAFLDGEKLRVSMEFCHSYPYRLSDEQKAMFDASSQDDKILMCILASDYPIEGIVLVSYDNGILIKAKAWNLNILRMPEEYLLREELSEEEKELALCKKELADLKNRMPKPILVLNNEKAVLTLKYSPSTPIEAVVKEHMEKIKRKYPHIGMPNSNQKGNLSGIMLGKYGLFDASGITSYNSYIDTFYDKEEKHSYLALKQEYLEQQMQMLSFALLNEGTDETGRGEDYAIIFDYHDDIVIFNKEENAGAVDFYQIKTTDKYYWTLSELYNAPSAKESVKKEKSFLAKLLIHTLTIPSTRNLFFVTNKYVSKSSFDKKPGDEFSFSCFKDESKKKMTEGLKAEVPFIRTEDIEKNHFVTNQMKTNDYLFYMQGLVSDFIKRRYPHADINPDEFYKSIMYEIKRKNNHEKVIDDLWELKEKKSISKSRFHDLVSGMCHVELFKQRQKAVLEILKRSGANFNKIHTMRKVLEQFHADIMDYDNISINRIMNEISNVTIQQVIESQMHKLLLQELTEHEQKGKLRRSELEREIEQCSQKIKTLEGSLRKDEIEKDFYSFVLHGLKSMKEGLGNIHNLNIEFGSKIRTSGSMVTKCVLSYTYAYCKLIIKYNGPLSCPIVIDEPNQNGCDEKSMKAVLDYILASKPTTSQLILSVNEDEVIDKTDKLVIDLSGESELLCESEFRDVKDEIENLLASDVLYLE